MKKESTGRESRFVILDMVEEEIVQSNHSIEIDEPKKKDNQNPPP